MSDFNESKTDRILTSCGYLYLTTVFTKDKKVKKMFAKLGKSGSCPGSYLDALSYLIKLAIRADVPTSKIIKGLKGISCHNPSDQCQSCADAFAIILEKHIGGDIK